MDSKYIAIVYDNDMNDILSKANVLGSFDGMYPDAFGRYSEMQFHEIGFDYPTWKQLRDAKIDIDYYDDEGLYFSLSSGRCTNHNVKVKIKDIVNEELLKAQAIRDQISLRDKYIDLADENGICEYTEKKAKIVPAKKAASLVAVDNDSDLIMPFREIKQGGDNLPLFIYLHDKKSRGTTNSTMLLKECKQTIAALKASKEEYMLVVPNVVTSYGMFNKIDGKSVQVANSLNKLLAKIINYEVSVNNVDPKRIYIMGMGSGVEDVLTEISLNNGTYAGAIMAFGVGYYDNVDVFANIAFEVASASEDADYAEEEISNMVQDIQYVESPVNYAELEGKVPDAMKAFFKDTTWLSNIFAVRRENAVLPPLTATMPLRKAQVTEDVASEE